MHRQTTEERSMEPSDLLTLQEVADRLRVPIKTIYAMRSNGTAPRGVRVGKHVRVFERDLARWLEDHADQPRPAA